MLHKNRGNRRWVNELEAHRKQELRRRLYGDDGVGVLGKLRKGKVHCSCPYCAAKTNNRKLTHSMGPVCKGRTQRIAGTYGRLGNNWTHADTVKIIAAKQQLSEYQAAV